MCDVWEKTKERKKKDRRKERKTNISNLFNLPDLLYNEIFWRFSKKPYSFLSKVIYCGGEQHRASSIERCLPLATFFSKLSNSWFWSKARFEIVDCGEKKPTDNINHITINNFNHKHTLPNLYSYFVSTKRSTKQSSTASMHWFRISIDFGP